MPRPCWASVSATISCRPSTSDAGRAHIGPASSRFLRSLSEFLLCTATRSACCSARCRPRPEHGARRDPVSGSVVFTQTGWSRAARQGPGAARPLYLLAKRHANVYSLKADKGPVGAGQSAGHDADRNRVARAVVRISGRCCFGCRNGLETMTYGVPPKGNLPGFVRRLPP